jgi:SAM-dependent methyltransferase
VRFHEDGKASLDDIYTQPDPRTYFTALRKLDYQIPQLAKPYFTRLMAELRQACPRLRMLDIGCSYGINAALLRCDVTLDDLYERYGGPDAGRRSRAALLDADRSLVASSPTVDTFVGLDVSRPALAYGREVGFLDVVVAADLEAADPTPEQAGALGGADLVTSTGCIGYVTETTLARVIAANADRPPWMAHFVLRMYPFAPIEACLAERGYVTTTVDRLFKQRLFASPEEQSQVLDTLCDVGVDPSGLESDGWLYAQLYLSRPRAS